MTRRTCMRSVACSARAARCCSRRRVSRHSSSSRRIPTLRPHCQRAVVTGFPESEDLIAAINAGHLHYVITKPWKLQDLLQVVEQLIHTHRLERDNHRLLAELRIANQSLREHESVLVAQLDERGREINAATL